MELTIWICTNGRPSNGALALAQQPGFARCKKGGKIKPTDFVINWGSSKPLDLKKEAKQVLNQPQFIAIATNKLEFFQYVSGPEGPGHCKTVEWTNDKAVAQQWLADKKTVVVRQKLTGHSGDGIVIVEPGEIIPDAPLYTKYIYKTKEYRVHVVNGQVVDTQQKIRDPAQEPKTWKVRSHANGFIFARNNIEPDGDRDALSVAAVKALGLDFGAVDIVQDKKGTYYVLEINTAPGLEGQTIESYANAFRTYDH